MRRLLVATVAAIAGTILGVVLSVVMIRGLHGTFNVFLAAGLAPAFTAMLITANNHQYRRWAAGLSLAALLGITVGVATLSHVLNALLALLAASASSAILASAFYGLWLRPVVTFPPHCCRHCGYDLTGNTSGVCPECGTTINHRNKPTIKAHRQASHEPADPVQYPHAGRREQR